MAIHTRFSARSIAQVALRLTVLGAVVLLVAQFSYTLPQRAVAPNARYAVNLRQQRDQQQQQQQQQQHVPLEYGNPETDDDPPEGHDMLEGPEKGVALSQKLKYQPTAVAHPPSSRRTPPPGIDPTRRLASAIRNVDSVAQTAPGTNAAATAKSQSFYANVLVHFDMKGAPPRPAYFIDYLKLAKSAGVTGILLEYEDMFPWTGPLESAANGDHYSLEDINTMLDAAKKLDLEIIPLVQTFGHLEWLLKLEPFMKHRENPLYPQVLCLGDTEGVDLVKEALRQVIEVHRPFGLRYVHIGADEAFQFGVCEKSTQRMTEKKISREELALTHLADIATFVKKTASTDGGQEPSILAWHDMLQHFPGTIIQKLGLGQLIEPVVWDYSENLVTLSEATWLSLSTNFDHVWASSATKGANFPDAVFSDVQHYLRNNRRWIAEKIRVSPRFVHWRGIILTAWQRYDHLAVFCELLPTGTPSMILNAHVAKLAPTIDEKELFRQTAVALGCTGEQELKLTPDSSIHPVCKFPGSDAYYAVQVGLPTLVREVDATIANSHPTKGWMNLRYHARHNLTQPWYLREVEATLQTMHVRIDNYENSIRNAFAPLYFNSTTEEWLMMYVDPIREKVDGRLIAVRRLNKPSTYPRRPFPIQRSRRSGGDL